MTAVIERTVVTEPGVYDMPEDEYHRHPALSSSGARDLLAPSCPAIFRYKADHPEPHKRHFDIGSAAHKLVLGVGPELRLMPFDNYLTKAAKAARDEAWAEDAIPLLADEYATVHAMAAELARHDFAASLFNPDRGLPEQSLFWTDEETGVQRRARLDWLPEVGRGRLIVPDYKTAASVEPGALAKTTYNLGYYQQAAQYIDAVETLVSYEATFVFVAQMKTPPFLVTVFDLDADAIALGRERNREALEIFRDCTAAGIWPGFAQDVVRISLPPYAGRASREVAW